MSAHKFASFLPPAVNFLRESTSISLAQKIQQIPILTPLHSQPIATACVRQGIGGTPLVLLHGFDSSMLEFSRLLPLLANHNETWLFDLLGFGFTERLSGLSFTPTTLKTHLYYCWKSLIDQPVILIGASMGGAAAIDFALTYPEAVKKLILINSLGYSSWLSIGQLLFPPFDYLAVEFWRQRKLQALTLGSLSGWDSHSLEALRCVCLHMEMPAWHEALSNFTKSGSYAGLEDKIPLLNTPTQILWGELDNDLGTDDARKFKQNIKNSQLIWLSNCGHTPHLEKPAPTAQHILEFR